MIKLDTKHKRKSFIVTTLVHVVILLLLFYLGLDSIHSEEEEGIALNFGTTSLGSGVQQNQRFKSTFSKSESVVKQTFSKTNKADSKLKEEIVTQEVFEAPVIEKKKREIFSEKPIETLNKENKPTLEEKSGEGVKKEIKDQEIQKKPAPKPDKSTLDILKLFSKGSKGKNEERRHGDGTDTEVGDKGKAKGDPYANSYYGKPGFGGLGYGLNGRGRPTNSIVKQSCNEAGIVVVEIVVDRSGKVIKAVPGVKGTTNNTPCLLDPAKKTALTFRWKADPNAPEKQIGFVEINFSLGE